MGNLEKSKDNNKETIIVKMFVFLLILIIAIFIIIPVVKHIILIIIEYKYVSLLLLLLILFIWLEYFLVKKYKKRNYKTNILSYITITLWLYIFLKFTIFILLKPIVPDLLYKYFEFFILCFFMFFLFFFFCFKFFFYLFSEINFDCMESVIVFFKNKYIQGVLPFIFSFLIYPMIEPSINSNAHEEVYNFLSAISISESKAIFKVNIVAILLISYFLLLSLLISMFLIIMFVKNDISENNDNDNLGISIKDSNLIKLFLVFFTIVTFIPNFINIINKYSSNDKIKNYYSKVIASYDFLSVNIFCKNNKNGYVDMIIDSSLNKHMEKLIKNVNGDSEEELKKKYKSKLKKENNSNEYNEKARIQIVDLYREKDNAIIALPIWENNQFDKNIVSYEFLPININPDCSIKNN
ncbi:hypothetical protein EV694_0666 [Volucribacter psittacicida]|uniref:Uncharacterized protein n=1 Tax=Volucribacter psittacicida TaxID=203482 RepID=A0A4R1G2Z9_9PAST|nr:hypothetical protein [Volucribacter psittacicida]TCK02018.1 hypothetical protein EV694_0666 [Volucribacter psittacicida]